MFQDYFLLHFLFNILRLLFVSFGSMFQGFSSISHTKNSLHFHLLFPLLLLYIHMPITLHAIAPQIHSNKKRCHLLSTFQWHLRNSKSKDLIRESMKFYHVAHSIKRIEILLSHIKDKNKLKNRDFLFSLVQCFKTTFCYIFYSIF